MRYAIIEGSVVRNVATWDGVTPWDPGLPIIELMAGEICGPGWSYDPDRTPRFGEPDDGV